MSSYSWKLKLERGIQMVHISEITETEVAKFKNRWEFEAIYYISQISETVKYFSNRWCISNSYLKLRKYSL